MVLSNQTYAGACCRSDLQPSTNCAERGSCHSSHLSPASCSCLFPYLSLRARLVNRVPVGHLGSASSFLAKVHPSPWCALARPALPLSATIPKSSLNRGQGRHIWNLTGSTSLAGLLGISLSETGSVCHPPPTKQYGGHLQLSSQLSHRCTDGWRAGQHTAPWPAASCRTLIHHMYIRIYTHVCIYTYVYVLNVKPLSISQLFRHRTAHANPDSSMTRG